KDLRSLKKTFHQDRLTTIEPMVEELTIDIEVTVAKENVIATVTKDGYVKRTSIRSYSASNGEEFAMKDGDHLLSLLEINTTDTILLFTNLGKFLSLPVHELPDIRWKDLGQHISNIVPLDKEEHFIQCVPV